MGQHTEETQDERPRVLVVEDEVFVRVAVTDCFEHAGFIVVPACSAHEAIHIFSGGQTIVSGVRAYETELGF